MKKVFAFLLACVMMVGILSGCGSKSESSSSAGSSSSEPEEKSVTLRSTAITPRITPPLSCWLSSARRSAMTPTAP